MKVPVRALIATLAVLTSLPAQHADPARQEVPLPAQNGWRASLVLDNGVGVWTVKAFQVQEQFGAPEIVGLDDEGRCIILRSYSGKWTPMATVGDGRWLAPVAHADVDPELPGKELYAGGQSGRVYQIWPRPTGGFDTRVIAEWPGDEIHTLIAGELDAERAGSELYAFTLSGELWSVRPKRGAKPVHIASIGGRVRDAQALPVEGGGSPWIATVSRAREVALYRTRGGQIEKRVVLREDMGFGRIVHSKDAEGHSILYVTRDDGLVLRLEQQGQSFEDCRWKREIIYAGPQGLRGIVTGRLHEDPLRECVAVFGYSKRVQLLTRLPGQPWEVETIFEDLDKGHWLALAELDGRNATREIICSGYSGRICMLHRPPAYGLPGVPTDPDHVAPARRSHPSDAAGREMTQESTPKEEQRVALRVAVRARMRELSKLSPLGYTGGFHTKSLAYETLVRRGKGGYIVPGLAESWSIEDGGKRIRFQLRPDATWHDGKAVHARDVAVHFRRWLHLPEHSWLRACEQIRSVEVVGPKQLALQLEAPAAVLPELCAINPCAVQGPGALDREGAFVHPIGSGPWRVLSIEEDHYLYERVRDGMRIALLPFPRQDADAVLASLRSGETDVFFGGWDDPADPSGLRQAGQDQGLELRTAPGSAVRYVSFALDRGPTADPELRRVLRAWIDRDAMIEELEAGLADPCLAWSAPALACWPASSLEAHSTKARPHEYRGTRLRLLCEASKLRMRRIGECLARQLRSGGFDVELSICQAEEYRRKLEQGEWDLRIERSWGVPYDPYLSFVSRFLPPTEEGSAASNRYYGVDPRLEKIARRVLGVATQDQRFELYREAQRIIDEDALVIPLYAPRRFAICRAGIEGTGLPLDAYRIELKHLRDGAQR
jgi:nickel transport system substrate-binding protein